MKSIPNVSCHKTQNLTDKAISLYGFHLSIACSGSITPGDGDIPDQNQPRESGLPETTCAFCKNDFEGTTLDKLSIYPICEPCKADLNKKTFPLWVKLFFIGVLVIVVFSVFWNWRFYSAYMNVKKSNRAYVDKNVTDAAYLMTKASKEVPEVRDMASLASYFTGINLLQKDKSTEALAEFENCKDLPPDLNVNVFVLQAEMGSGFDKKDYKLFLTASKAFLQLDTTQSQSWAGVASAYACLYAQNNADSLKQQSLKYVGKAKALNDTSGDAKEFYGRILYRLDTRQIISKGEFDKKYPNGYPLR